MNDKLAEMVRRANESAREAGHTHTPVSVGACDPRNEECRDIAAWLRSVENPHWEDAEDRSRLISIADDIENLLHRRRIVSK